MPDTDRCNFQCYQRLHLATTNTWDAASSGSGVSYAIRGGSGIDVTEVTETDGSKTLVISLAAGA